jgi:hypothetical protein
MNYCTEYPDLIRYVNLCDYTLSEVILIFLGTVFWIVAYFIIVRNAFRNKYVEMPAVAGAANVAWEFTWAFVLHTDLGLIFVWGLRAWFFIDVLILYSLLRWGAKQYHQPILIRNFRLITILQILIWIPAFVFFYQEGYDTSMGATSAYVICVPMAVLYVTSFLSSHYKLLYSPWVAWLKWLGNSFMAVYVLIRYPDLHFLHMMAFVVFVFNIWYIALRMGHRTADTGTKP